MQRRASAGGVEARLNCSAGTATGSLPFSANTQHNNRAPTFSISISYLKMSRPYGHNKIFRVKKRHDIGCDGRKRHQSRDHKWRRIDRRILVVDRGQNWCQSYGTFVVQNAQFDDVIRSVKRHYRWDNILFLFPVLWLTHKSSITGTAWCVNASISALKCALLLNVAY